MREDLMIALSADHPLAKSSSISARELRNEAFIVPQFSESEGLGEILANLGRRGGFDAEPRYRVADFITALCMTTAGYGVVLVPHSMKSLAPADVAFRAIGDYRDEIELALAYRTREVAPCVKKFVDATIARYPRQSSSRRR
ncbi:LysR family transcriptional regulator [Caballeronia arvi]|uniref:LysR family transcriptional regulator n=2 Tax=Caballeronia arvi TaxID=1777135 RepID=A0A158KQK2_9BURK|nr:LysR family transcriptional regulator [Caballeronia arvi]